MFFSNGDLSRKIKNLVAEGGSRCAVAFVGKEALEIIPKYPSRNTQVICNLLSGATNPYAIVELMKRRNCEVRRVDDLHAKVYLGDTRAIITSANLSANGLGYETVNGISGWQEAGYEVTDENKLKEIREWYKALWRDSLEISDGDIEEAKERWFKHQGSRPSNKSFEEYVSSGGGGIMLAWATTERRWEHTESGRLAAKNLGKREEEVRAFIDDAIEITEKDKGLFKTGTWVLWFSIDEGDELQVRGETLEWFQCGEYIHDAYKFSDEDYERPVVTRLSSNGAQPFILDKNFKKKFVIKMNNKIKVDHARMCGNFIGGFYKKSKDEFELLNFMKDES
tara:strand:+ start:351 stop:1364 length:1014 start_codon:yes stop_codon:yes gene_type:complete